jgi:hypothetical protein
MQKKLETQKNELPVAKKRDNSVYAIAIYPVTVYAIAKPLIPLMPVNCNFNSIHAMSVSTVSRRSPLMF